MDDIDDSRQSTHDPVTSARRALSSSIAIGVILLLTVGITAAGVTSAQQTARAERRADAERAVARSTLNLEGAVDEVVAAIEDTARFVLTPGGPEAIDRLPAPAGTTSLGFVAPDDAGELREIAGRLPAELVAAPELLTAAGRSRDRGEVLVNAPVDAGGVAVVAVAVPIYRGDRAALSRTSPDSSTTGRRAAIAGWVVATLDPELLIAEATTETTTLPAVAVFDGDTLVAGDPPPTDGSEVSFTTGVPGRSWLVVGTAEAAPLLPGASPWLLVAAMAVVIITLVASRSSGHRRYQAAVEAAAHRRQAEMIRRFAPVVQQSLDLADVLPALAVQLVDELNLAGMSLSIVGSGATEIGLFSVGDLTGDGRPPDDETPPQVRVPESLAAGERLTLSLQRGGRAVATLRLCAGRALDRTELESVQVACELTTAAMVNARTFEQQQEAVDRLSSVDELKTVFLATASHELRTPVTAITAFSVLLDERWDQLPDADRRMFASRIAQNSRSLEAMVQDLLDFSQLERGRLVVSIDEVDIDEAVAAMVERLTPFWPTHTLALDVRGRARVQADRAGIDRVFTNLLSNAVKFSPAGSTVTTTVDVIDDVVTITVDDEGPGVPLADRDRVFASFFRGSATEVVRTRGTGVGLSVAKQYIDQMGGSIEVGDSPAGGARFTVRLRRAAMPQAVLTPGEPRRSDDEDT